VRALSALRLQAVFADDCRFKDPTTDVAGLARYMAALDILFDPASSRVVLLECRATGPRQVTARWTLQGYLKFPWHPYVPPCTCPAAWISQLACSC